MRWLVVGMGGIGQRHVRNIRRLFGDGVEILAWRTRGLQLIIDEHLQAKPGHVESEYGVQAMSSLDAALDRRPDVALVCTPTSLHIPTALTLAKSGCHLLIEKPLAHSLEGVDTLIATVEQRGLTALVGYQMRFHPCLVGLRSVLQRGLVGRLLSVHAEVGESLPSWHQYEDYRGTYAARASLGGGVVLSQIHELDYVYWLFGTPRRVFGLGGHFSTLQIDVEDTASMLLECELDGRCLPVHVHADYLQSPPTRTCVVIGERGKARVDFRVPSLEIVDSSGSVIESVYPKDFQRNQLFLDELSHFVECIDGRSSPIVSLRDGLESLRMALAARESIATGQVVTL